MHMKNKSVRRICCTIISTITIMGTALGVSADTADKLYTFSLYTSEANTGSYYKDNSSSVYVNPTMSPANGVQFAGYRYDGATWYNETIGGWAYIAAGTKRRLQPASEFSLCAMRLFIQPVSQSATLNVRNSANSIQCSPKM